MNPSEVTQVGEELKTFTQTYMAAWRECDTDAMANLLTDDIVWHDPALPAPARGIGEVQEFMRRSFRTFPDLAFDEADPAHLTATGDLVSWAWRMTGTMRGDIDPPGFAATGARIDIEGVDLWQMRDGKIAHYRALYNMSEIALQLELMPTPGSRAEKMAVAMQRLQVRFKR